MGEKGEARELPWKCPVCGARFMTEEELREHVAREHRRRREEEEEEKAERVEEVTVKGIRIRRGDCLRAIISRSTYVFKVEDFTENPSVVRGVDIYGNEIALDLRKAIVLSKIKPEKFEFLQERGRRAEAKVQRARKKKAKRGKKEGER
jgi:hypothetical protein